MYILIYTTVPVPSITLNTLNNQTVGQSLTLECTVTTVRGITSRMNIVWSSDDLELSIVKGINTSSLMNGSVLFTDVYVIPQLSTADENREYLCEVSIDTDPSVTANDSIMLNVTGKDSKSV